MKTKPFAIISDIVLVVLVIGGAIWLFLQGTPTVVWNSDGELLPLVVDWSRILIYLTGAAVVLGLLVAALRRNGRDKLVNGDVADFYYRVQTSSQLVGIGDPPPSSLALRAAPSPARTATALGFGIAQTGHARLAIYDLTGRLRRLLVDHSLPAGSHVVTWDLRDDGGVKLAAGVYWARLEVDAGGSSTRVVVLED